MGKRVAVALKKSTVKDLEARDQTYRVNDLDANGLALQVTPAGAKSWVLRFRDAAGGQKTITLGRWPEVGVDEARRRATAAKAKVDSGVPLVTKRSSKPPKEVSITFHAVAEDFYREWVLVKNMPSYQHYQRWALNKHVLPALGDMPLTEVTVPIISKFLDGLSGTPTTANRVKALLSKLFNWARRRYKELEGVANPVQGHEHHEETARESRLSEADLKVLGERYRTSQDPLRHPLALLLLTGARAGVVLELAEVNRSPEEKMLRFEAKAPGLKGCRAVYLCGSAVKLLPSIPTLVDRGALWRAWLRLRGDFDCSIHDLRRTFASVGADLGRDEAVVDALLGHSRGRIKDTYIRRADPTLLEAAESIGGYIAGLLGIAEVTAGNGLRDALATPGHALQDDGTGRALCGPNHEDAVRCLHPRIELQVRRVERVLTHDDPAAEHIGVGLPEPLAVAHTGHVVNALLVADQEVDLLIDADDDAPRRLRCAVDLVDLDAAQDER